MTIWMVFGVVLIGTAAAVLLRQSQPIFALMIGVAVGMVLVIAVIADMVPLIERVTDLLGYSSASRYTSVLTKAVGISLVTRFAADTCRDAGESSLAGKAELAGRVLLLLCAMPLFEQAASLLESLIRGQAVVI